MRTEVTVFEKQCDFFGHGNTSPAGSLQCALILVPAGGVFMALR